MPKVNVQYHSEMMSGYGRMGSEIVKSLVRYGVEPAGRLDSLQNPKITSTSVILPSAVPEIAHCALWLSTPPAAKRWVKGQHASILTMWESTQMPAGFREGLENFDRIFVPCDQNLELFSQYHDDVRKIPLGVDPAVWHFQPRRAVESDFNFMTAGFGPRKNVKQVVEAFQLAFPGGYPIGDGPVPHLYVRSRDEVGGPNVHLISSSISESEEVSLYAQMHCYVSGSRGEGWGLMPLQAIAQGCPTILGDHSGHSEFAKLGIGIGWHHVSAAGATFWGDGGQWWEPNLDEMVDAMRAVYADPTTAFRDAQQGSAAALALYTWDNCAQELIYNLPEMFLDPPKELVWHEQDLTLYRVVVNPGTPDYTINGIVHHFVPGREYWEPFDMKRQLLVSGHLNTLAVDIDEIGVPAELKTDLRAFNEKCHTCGQRYNSDPLLQLVTAGKA